MPGDYNKLIAYFNYGAPSGLAKRSRVQVGWVKEDEFIKSTNVSSSIYRGMAACDLSSMFIPFQATSGNNDLPGFRGITQSSSSSVYGSALLPFRFDAAASGKYDVLQDASGSYTPFLDNQKTYITGSGFNPRPDDVRDPRDIRGLAIRGPILLAGWGFDTDGNKFPRGSGINKFAGEVDYGWQIDPKDFVVAPLDVRYDTTRNVWAATSTGGGSSVRHRHLLNTTTDGGPAFASFFPDSVSAAIALGYSTIIPGLAELGN